MSRIRLGIVGLSADGGWGQRAHFPALNQLGDQIEIYAVCGSSQDAANRSAKLYSIPVAYSDPELMSQDENIDAVAIIVRVPEHRRLLEIFISNNKHVFCEWPLSINGSEANKLAVLAKKHNVVSMIGFQARMLPVIQQLPPLLTQIGPILSVSVIGSGGGWYNKATTRSEYTYDIHSGASMLSVPFGHMIDVVTYLLGDFIDVNATLDINIPYATNVETGEQITKTVHDNIIVIGHVGEGVPIVVHYRAGKSAITNFLLEINGENGDISLTAPSGHIQFGNVSLSVSSPKLTPLINKKSIDTLLDNFIFDEEVESLILKEYLIFVNAIQSGTSLNQDFSRAEKIHHLIDKIYASADSGTMIKL